MGKSIGWKVGNTYYDGRVATDWERLPWNVSEAADNWEEFDKLFKKAMGEPVQTQLDFTIKE